MPKQLNKHKPKSPNKEKRKKNPKISKLKTEPRRSKKRENPKGAPRSKLTGVAFRSMPVSVSSGDVVFGKDKDRIFGRYDLDDQCVDEWREKLDIYMGKQGITKDQTFHDAPTFYRSWYREELRVVKMFVAAMKTLTPEALVTLLFSELKAEMGPEQFDFLPKDYEQNKKYWEKINSTQTKP